MRALSTLRGLRRTYMHRYPPPSRAPVKEHRFPKPGLYASQAYSDRGALCPFFFHFLPHPPL